jgi:hypothetical protein
MTFFFPVRRCNLDCFKAMSMSQFRYYRLDDLRHVNRDEVTVRKKLRKCQLELRKKREAIREI